MKKLATLLAGAALMIGMATGMANAYTITYGGDTDVNGGLTTGQPGALLETFDLAPTLTLAAGGNGALATDSTSGVAAAPYGPAGADSTTYLVVTGSQTLNVPYLSNYLGLWWGSVDSYNDIIFFKGGIATGDTINGSQIASPANGSWTDSATNLYVNIFGLNPFDSFMLVSGTPAFEVDNVATAPVPEPGTMVLFGAGLLGLAIFGKRRMNKEA